MEREAPDYLEWRKKNPLGFVLNIDTWSATSPSTTNIIHDAGGCSSLNQSRTGNRERHGTKEHPKLCSTDIRELVKEMLRKGVVH